MQYFNFTSYDHEIIFMTIILFFLILTLGMFFIDFEREKERET